MPPLRPLPPLPPPVLQGQGISCPWDQSPSPPPPRSPRDHKRRALGLCVGSGFGGGNEEIEGEDWKIVGRIVSRSFERAVAGKDQRSEEDLVKLSVRTKTNLRNGLIGLLADLCGKSFTIEGEETPRNHASQPLELSFTRRISRAGGLAGGDWGCSCTTR